MNGSSLSLLWTFPFGATLLSIALFPLLAPKLWHRHYGKISNFWGLITLGAIAATYGVGHMGETLIEVLFDHYLPFIFLVGSLFIICGGIRLETTLGGSPLRNTLLLGVGAALASFLGTTGATILLIRPLLSTNRHRLQRAHLVIFLILIVSNCAGALTPLGDPPLFLGFLQGVDFLWPTRTLFYPWLILNSALLLLFFGVDSWMVRKEPLKAPPPLKFWIRGRQNAWFLLVLLLSVLLSGLWKDAPSLSLFSHPVALNDLARDLFLLFLGLLSYTLTPPQLRIENAFSWDPFKEVMLLFFALFITVTPVLTILKAQDAGALGAILHLLQDPLSGEPHALRYFWTTGMLSAFLDNAPTYLVFFESTGTSVQNLMQSPLLVAISCGAVFMGALTYVGNAPNFMAKSIAEEHKIKMPGFFTYAFIASIILLPLFSLLSWIFFV